MTSTFVKVGAIATTAAALYSPLGVPATNSMVIDMLSSRQAQSPSAVFPLTVLSSNVRAPAVPHSVSNDALPEPTEGVAMQQIDRIRALSDGWLGENSFAPSDDLVDHFAVLSAEVDKLPDAHSLAPTGEGGLLLEWISYGSEYTAELEPDGSLFMSVALFDGEIVETEIPFDPILLKRFVSSGSWLE